ncbi:MAG: RNA polymerase factor sigma-54 [Spirochaetes bacterium]|jgi:RNA polymerase sigma-54 factor|nr:RNA polymerase factor sigma-54 [Spirochaetota bacterium]
MGISLQVGLKQTQKLAMTQSLRQAIELLQLSTLDLYERITAELVENPVLEEDLSSTSPFDTEDMELADQLGNNLNGEDIDADRYDSKEESGYEPEGYSRDVSDGKNLDLLEKVVADQETLADHLIWQARMTAKDEHEFEIYESIITALDENGFLPRDAEILKEKRDKNPGLFDGIKETITLFDPVGCAVTGIRESLTVQARHFYPEDEVLHKILGDHFVDLEKLNYEKIARDLSIPIPVVSEKSRVIQGLDPFPGRQYSSRKTRYLMPDMEVKIVDGEIVITMNDEWLPEIRINAYYTNMLRKKSIDKNLRKYIQEKVQSARYLIKNISSRRNTIRKVVYAIMDRQMQFLVKGPGNLNPLTHLEIAQEVGMHESTVSRVTTNKYVQTGWGVFELKDFFVSRLKSGGTDDDRSSDQAMSLIKDIIAYENPESPFSDEEIAERLEKAGVSAARRTIAKYRGILNIPSSNRRKKINLIKSEEIL